MLRLMFSGHNLGLDHWMSTWGWGGVSYLVLVTRSENGVANDSTCNPSLHVVNLVHVIKWSYTRRSYMYVLWSYGVSGH